MGERLTVPKVERERIAKAIISGELNEISATEQIPGLTVQTVRRWVRTLQLAKQDNGIRAEYDRKIAEYERDIAKMREEIHELRIQRKALTTQAAVLYSALKDQRK